MSDWVYIVAGFGLTWIVLIGYAGYLRRRVRRAEAALAEVLEGGEEAEK